MGTVVLQSAVLFNYFWGNLTLQYALRLGIVFLPFVIVLAVFVIDWVTESGRCRRKYVVVPLLGLLCFHWSVAGKNEAVREIFFYREFRLVSEWLRTNLPKQDAIVVSDLSNLYTPFRYSVVSFGTINACPEAWVERVKRHLFQSLLTVQKIRYSDGQPSVGTFLSEKFLAEKLFETQLNAEEFLRISRIVSLRPPAPPASAAAEVAMPVAAPPGSVTVQATATVVVPIASGTFGQ